MKKIVIGTTEIEVISLTPIAYTQTRSEKEKVLLIEVDATLATFEELRTLLEGAKAPVQYWEDDTMLCEYVGYGVFTSQYKNGVHYVELHKTSLVEQMSALLIANERLATANTALQKTAKDLTAQNEKLTAQNELLDNTLSELLETVLPETLEGLSLMVMDHEERLIAVELQAATEPTETAEATEGEAVTE